MTSGGARADGHTDAGEESTQSASGPDAAEAEELIAEEAWTEGSRPVPRRRLRSLSPDATLGDLETYAPTGPSAIADPEKTPQRRARGDRRGDGPSRG